MSVKNVKNWFKLKNQISSLMSRNMHSLKPWYNFDFRKLDKGLLLAEDLQSQFIPKLKFWSEKLDDFERDMPEVIRIYSRQCINIFS